jgi:hypothetical protein
VVSIDSCGNAGAVLETCVGGQVCADGACTEPFSSRSGAFTLVADPVTKAAQVGDTGVFVTFDWSELDLAIDATGKAAAEMSGSPTFSALEAVGSLQGAKLSLAAMLTEELEEGALIRQFSIIVLFDGDDGFKGTVKELLFWSDTSAPPVSVERDITGTRAD